MSREEYRAALESGRGMPSFNIALPDPKTGLIEPTDFIKINKTRRTRGYRLEYDLVNKFKKIEHWNARRLGGSSTGLPDVVATRNPTETEFSTVMAIECKEGRDTYVLEVPADQIQRCIDTCNFLGAYHKQYVVFAFKFMKSEKLKRPKTIIRFWTFALNDPYLNAEGLVKACYDIRYDNLKVHFDGGVSNLPPTFLDGYRADFVNLVTSAESRARY